MSEPVGSSLFATLGPFAAVVVFIIGGLAHWAIGTSPNVTETRQAIRRNYPVIGRFRDLFERLGEFCRQYFFAMGRNAPR